MIPVQSKCLADSCVMVCWYQRMAGKSYRRKNADKPLTVDQQCQELHAVILYLLGLFGKEKLFG